MADIFFLQINIGVCINGVGIMLVSVSMVLVSCWCLYHCNVGIVSADFFSRKLMLVCIIVVLVSCLVHMSVSLFWSPDFIKIIVLFKITLLFTSYINGIEKKDHNNWNERVINTWGCNRKSVIKYRPWWVSVVDFGLYNMVNIVWYGGFWRHNPLLQHHKMTGMVGFCLSTMDNTRKNKWVL
jgi:hypothetical protein